MTYNITSLLGQTNRMMIVVEVVAVVNVVTSLVKSRFMTQF